MTITLSTAQAPKSRINTWIDTTENKELIMVQELIVTASVGEVWKAYTTSEGWEAWAVPIAEVDLKINGIIQTNYNKEGRIGDSTTIVIHILNYIPEKLLTLQAEIADNFPGFMKEDERDFYNVITFKALNPRQTKIISYGMGYKETPQYHSMMKFFIEGNEYSLLNLLRYLEDGISPEF